MTPTEKKLLRLFGELAPGQRETLMAFAEFLHAQGNAERAEIGEPQPIARPERESVVGALKRLSATYPMVDKGKMLNETSVLVAQHVMEGRAAAAVIDELEVLFERHYLRLKDDGNDR